MSDIKKTEVTLTLDEGSWHTLAFCLEESYAKWGMELNHHSREGHYSGEVMGILDTLDDVHEQLQEAGYGWETDL